MHVLSVLIFHLSKEQVDISLIQLQKLQNTIIRAANKKDGKYPTKNIYEGFNVLNINQEYQKAITIYFKNINVYLQCSIKSKRGTQLQY